MLSSSMLRNLAIGLVGGIVALVAACGSETPPSEFGTSSGNEADGGSSGGFVQDSGPPPPPVECKKMDIVFVIDNSQSMEEEQDNLAKNFPAFIDILNDYRTAEGEPLDYRVAITSTDDAGDDLEPWTRGKFTRSRGGKKDLTCDPGPNNERWLTREDPDIADHFACRAQLGTLGSNVERPLEAAKLAVTARIQDGTNTRQGIEPFLREDALLAFVIITDEDEGGADGTDPPPAPLKNNVTEYLADFDAVKAGLRGRWAAAVIAGDRGCTSELGMAADAKRLKQFIAGVGANGVFSSICEGDLTKGLQEAIAKFAEACKGFPGVK